MSNRLITDNILVAFETLHHLKNKRTGKTGSMALKLNMSEAYARVEWNCFESLMDRLGFERKWFDLINSCIWYVSFSVLINSEPHGLIQPQRGLKQGDSLLPYLFLLCAEGSHALISKLRIVKQSRVSLSAEMGLKLLTCFLQMIVCFSVKRTIIIAILYWNSWIIMNWHLASRSIVRKHSFFQFKHELTNSGFDQK